MKDTRRIFIIHVFLLLIVRLLFAPAAAQENSRSPAPSKSRTESNNEAVPYSNLDPSTAILIMVIVMAFFFIGFFVIYIRQCTSDTSVSPGAAAGAGAASFPPRSRLVGLEPTVIETFPVLLYSEVKEIKIGRETLECAVCLCEFEDDETLRLLPKCSHVFHPDCIDLWLASHVTCPVCRANLKPEPGEAAKTESNEQPSNQQQQQSDALSPPEIGDTRPQNDVVITVEEEEEEEQQQRESVRAVAMANRPPRSRISGKFPRSHSTGHSLAQPGENVDRYTLRLPEEARRQIMATARLKRVRSFNVIFAGEGSLRKGYSGSAAAGGGFGEGSSRGRLMERFERWVLLRTPPFPFVSKGGSLRSVYDGDSSHGRKVLSSLSCLSWKADGADRSSTMMASPAHRRL